MTNTPTAETILERVASGLAAERRMPEATYRIQFHAGFTFRDASRIVPYLAQLGISHVYASPYLKARPGSMHGYDIVDHRLLNPEIGNEQDYDNFIHALHEHGLGQILDVVPNHMGIVGNENAWWNDVLENGPSSPYASFFDIDWDPIKPQLRGKVLLPVLGEPYGKALEAGQIQLRYEGGTFAAYYFDSRFPIAPKTSRRVLAYRLEELEASLSKESPDFMEYVSILTALSHLPGQDETDPVRIEERQREKEVVKRRLATLVEVNAGVRAQVEAGLQHFNGRPGDAHSFDPLDELLGEQAYRLSFWRVAADETNYRRFFDINELAALSMERPAVFEATHELILRLLREGKVNGLRIDHPDGLYDPRQYLNRLQARYVLDCARRLVEEDLEYRGTDWSAVEGPLRAAIEQQRAAGERSPLWRPLYVVVEKILEHGEPLRDDWPIYGTTGYEFLNWVNGLFVDPSGAQGLTRLYLNWSEVDPSFDELAYQKKFLILQVALSSEMHVLARQLDRLSEKNRWSRDFTLNSLRHALREIIACFPVYRSYIAAGQMDENDRAYISSAVACAKRRNPAISAAIFDFIRDVLLVVGDVLSPQDRDEQLRFIGKFQQVTGPVMAKGLEDTAFYNYNRLVSLNEVGGDPGRFGLNVPTFHRHNEDRQRRYPWALSATATHDTKRGEDVRARLDVLSEMPREWRRQLSHWNAINRRHRREMNGVVTPDVNDEYLLYQTIVGAWPLEDMDDGAYVVFVERVQEYMQKAIHEEKIHTSWINPNASYDDGMSKFVDRLLDRRRNRKFLDRLKPFITRVAHLGLFNSLSQALLKIASPGVPDIYQGTELWDLSLVDPDNRRPVDYVRRQSFLADLHTLCKSNGERRITLCRELVEHKEDGRIKLSVTHLGLRCRREHQGLFSVGDYLPAEAVGSRHEHIVAFVRSQNGAKAVAAVPRLIAGLLRDRPGAPLGDDVWQDTLVRLPGLRVGERFQNVLTGETLTTVEHGPHAALRAADLFQHFPVALVMLEH